MGGFAWVTLATNDSYSLGALVLAHSLKQAGTAHQLAVLITPGVTNAMREKLATVFNVVQEVNVLDSRDESNLRLLKRPELGITFTKLHCWRLTQFDKCVFLDADTLVLQNCDELFERDEFSAAPDVGWPDCFNSGVFVYRPSNDTYEKLIQFALEKGSFDGGDQGLLNLYFSDWPHKDISKHLPFIYNMCSTACYSYLPAFKQFGSDAKIIHFIGATKPWLQYFNTETRKVQPSGDSTHLRDVLQRWWDIFCSLIHPQLSPAMAGLAGAFAQLTLGVPRTEQQDALENLLRKQAWEVGNIDYMGRDSFENIWSKISETLSAGAPQTNAGPEPTAPEPAPVKSQSQATAPPQEESKSVETPVTPSQPIGSSTDTSIPVEVQTPVAQVTSEIPIPQSPLSTLTQSVESSKEVSLNVEDVAAPASGSEEALKTVDITEAAEVESSAASIPIEAEVPESSPEVPQPSLSEPVVEPTTLQSEQKLSSGTLASTPDPEATSPPETKLSTETPAAVTELEETLQSEKKLSSEALTGTPEPEPALHPEQKLPTPTPAAVPEPEEALQAEQTLSSGAPVAVSQLKEAPQGEQKVPSKAPAAVPEPAEASQRESKISSEEPAAKKASQLKDKSSVEGSAAASELKETSQPEQKSSSEAPLAKKASHSKLKTSSETSPAISESKESPKLSEAISVAHTTDKESEKSAQLAQELIDSSSALYQPLEISKSFSSAPVTQASPTPVSPTTAIPVFPASATPVSPIPVTAVSSTPTTPASPAPVSPKSATPVSPTTVTPVSSIPAEPFSSIPATPVCPVPPIPTSPVTATCPVKRSPKAAEPAVPERSKVGKSSPKELSKVSKPVASKESCKESLTAAASSQSLKESPKTKVTEATPPATPSLPQVEKTKQALLAEASIPDTPPPSSPEQVSTPTPPPRKTDKPKKAAAKPKK